MMRRTLYSFQPIDRRYKCRCGTSDQFSVVATGQGSGGACKINPFAIGR